MTLTHKDLIAQVHQIINIDFVYDGLIDPLRFYTEIVTGDLDKMIPADADKWKDYDGDGDLLLDRAQSVVAAICDYWSDIAMGIDTTESRAGIHAAAIHLAASSLPEGVQL